MEWYSLLGLSGAPLGLSGAPLGLSGAPLGLSGAPLGLSGAPLGFAISSENKRCTLDDMPTSEFGTHLEVQGYHADQDSLAWTPVGSALAHLEVQEYHAD